MRADLEEVQSTRICIEKPTRSQDETAEALVRVWQRQRRRGYSVSAKWRWELSNVKGYHNKWRVKAREMSRGWQDCEKKHWPCLFCHIRGLFEDSIVPEALASLCHSLTASSLWLPPLTDTIGHTGSQKNPRFQSHHCCEGNCSCLSCKSAPPLYKQRHIFTHCHENTRAHTHTHREKKIKGGCRTHRGFFHHFARAKTDCCCPAFYTPLFQRVAAGFTLTESASCSPCARGLLYSSEN